MGLGGNERVPPGSTTVEVILEPDGECTILSLRHSGLPDGESAAMHEEGWRFFSPRLAIVVAGGDAGPMPSISPGSLLAANASRQSMPSRRCWLIGG